MTVRYRLWESFRAVFYTPYYAALALDSFGRHGLEVEFAAVPPGRHIGTALRDGDVDVVWGGPMRIMLDRHENPDSDTVGFCEVVARDPFYLLSREPRPDFRLQDLTGLRLATVSEVPTPWMCLQEDLRRAGIDPASIQRQTGGTMPENLAALRAGTVDVIQIFEPWVEQALRAGEASICHVAADRGLTSYTTLYARRPFLQQHPDVAEQFVRGIHDAQRWIAAHDADALADLVSGFFPDLEREVLSGGIARYLRHEVWGKTPYLTREGFERQAAGLSSGGLIGPPPAYEDCIDMQFVERVQASTEES